jgi:hypothetical protein
MRVNPVMLLGVALMLLGIVALSYEGITYTSREKIVEIGPIEATAEREKTVPLPLILGALVFGSGVFLVIIAAKKD